MLPYDGRKPEPPHDCPSCSKQAQRIADLEEAARRLVGALEHTAGYKYSVDPYLESIFKEQGLVLNDPVIVALRRE